MASNKVVISALDLKRIEAENLLKQNLEQKNNEAIELAQRSKDRIKNWDSTIAGQRRKRIQARADHLKALEEERKRLDLIYAKENEERKKEILDRAQALLYAEKDEGKTFHSKVLLLQVLQERDEQVASKAKRQDFFKMYDKVYLEAVAKRAVKEDIERLRNEETLYIQKQRTKKELQEEIKVKELARKSQRTSELEEGRKVRAMDEAHAQNQKLVEAKHLQQQKANMATLQSQLKAVKDAKEKQRLDGLAEDEKIKRWAAKKDHQTALKQAMEQEIIAQSIRIRERLALTQQQQENDRENELCTKIEKAVQIKDEKARLAREQEAAKRARGIKEMSDYFHATQQRHREELEQRRREDQERLNLCLKEAALAKEEDARQRQKRFELAKQQEADNLALWKEAQVAKKRLVDEARQAQVGMAKDDLAREEQLLDYMKSVSNQDWALSNWRLQKHVREKAANFDAKKLGKESTARKASEIVSGSFGDTKERVGFAGGYNELDFTK